MTRWVAPIEGKCDVCREVPVLSVARHHGGASIKAYRCAAHAGGVFNMAYVNADGSWVILRDDRDVNPVFAGDLEFEFDG